MFCLTMTIVRGGRGGGVDAVPFAEVGAGAEGAACTSEDRTAEVGLGVVPVV